MTDRGVQRNMTSSSYIPVIEGVGSLLTDRLSSHSIGRVSLSLTECKQAVHQASAYAKAEGEEAECKQALHPANASVQAGQGVHQQATSKKAEQH